MFYGLASWKLKIHVKYVPSRSVRRSGGTRARCANVAQRACQLRARGRSHLSFVEYSNSAGRTAAPSARHVYENEKSSELTDFPHRVTSLIANHGHIVNTTICPPIIGLEMEVCTKTRTFCCVPHFEKLPPTQACTSQRTYTRRPKKTATKKTSAYKK